MSQDVRRLRHLHQERRLALRERVGRADAREDAVAEPDRRRGRRHERPDVREEDEERVLAEVRRLPAHVRSRQDEDAVVLPERGVVRDERVLRTERLDDRVAAVDDEEDRLVDELRTRPA